MPKISSPGLTRFFDNAQMSPAGGGQYSGNGRGRCKRAGIGLIAAFLLPLPASAQTASCDRTCLEGLTHQVLNSMVKHDPSVLPIAPRYRLTVDNVGSGLVMATPWRTITGIEGRGIGQTVIDVTRQEVFFTATVKEGSLPSLLWGRLKLEGGRLSELELFFARSKADGGEQFDALGAINLPPNWSTPIPSDQRSTRDELTRVAKADFDPSYGSLKRSGTCVLSENGKEVRAAFHSLEELRTVFGDVSPAVVERVRQAIAKHESTPIPCVDAQPPVDKSARILVDEEQGVVVTLAHIQGAAWPNFVPPPGPNPEAPTAWVPADMKADNARRAVAFRQLPASMAVPISRPTLGSVTVAEINRFYDGEVQATHRLLKTQAPNAVSPWTLQNPGDKD